MKQKAFEDIIDEEFSQAVSERFRARMKNVAFLVEQDISEEERREHGLAPGETLLGLYTGIPLTERGEEYGVGATMPDTIILFQRPLEEAAGGDLKRLRQVVRETLWHEVAHYFGIDEKEVRRRESRV